RATLTQGVTQVQLPAGEPVVRIQVTPGETIQLPFPQDAMVARLDDGNGNLAVRVGDITVILQGYIAAVGEADVTLLDNTGEAIDVAAVVAATDPNLDIQTAAGPAAGAPGVDNTGGVFDPFAPQAGLGGLNAVGGLNPTALDYGLVEREFILTDAEEVETTVDTVPEIVSITGGVVNEDDLGGGEGNDFSAAKALEPYPSHIVDGLTAALGGQVWAYWGNPSEDGNDPFDTEDHEEGSQQSGLPDDNGNGVDQDREPTTVTGIVSVNFFADLPGRLSFENGGTTPILDQLNAMGLTSHSHLLQYMVLPGQPDDPATGGIDESHGETLVAYYIESYTYGEQTYSYANIVFTIAFREFEGTDPLTDFNIDFTIYGVIDNVPGISDADGDITEALDLGVPFFVIDSNGSVVPVPAEALVFKDIDDVPSLGTLEYDWQVGLPVSVTPTDTDLVHDETKGEQSGTDDIDAGSYPGSYLVPQALAAANLAGATPVGVAYTDLSVSFGADGRAGVYDSSSNSYVGNKEAGETVFTGDKGTYAQAYQLYIGAANAPMESGTTNWTVTLDGAVVTVLARQVDANTIVGYAIDAQQNEVPVFVLHLDPQLGQLTFVQLHQINHDDPVAAPSFFNDSNEASPSLLVDGLPVSFRATDYDGDHVDAPLSVTTLDDAPDFVGAQYIHLLDEDFLPGGNQDADGTSGDNDGTNKTTGTFNVNFGTDQPGSFEVEVDSANFAGLQTVAGKNVLLAVSADQVIGYADLDGNGELDPAEAVDGNRVFLFEVHPVNASSAGFSLEIFQALKHENPEGVDSVETNIPLSFFVKAIDVDGDSIRMEVNFQVNDDAPTISVVDDHSVTVTLDESTGKDASDPNTAPEADDTQIVGAIGSATGSVTSFFENIAFGADGPMGGIANPQYKLVLRNAGGGGTSIGTTHVATNLYVTDSNDIYANDNVFLVSVSAFQVNGYLHHDGNPDNNILAFTIKVDPSSGELTVTQYLPIAHDDDGASPAAHDDIASLLVADGGGIFVSATVIDGDGDKVTAITENPLSIDFEDDGPKLISVVHDGEGGEPGPFLIDEDALDGGIADGPGDDAGGASVAYKVNVDFGTDGGAATAFVFVGANPSVSLTTADGQSITTNVLAIEVNGLPAGTVIGYTGADINDPVSWVFTATIDATSGAGAFTLLKPLYHPVTDDPISKDTVETAFEDNIAITLKVRAFDGDGDWINADIVIDIDDDSPVAANVVHDGDPVTEGGELVYLWTLAEFLDANVEGGADGYKAGSLVFAAGSLGGTLEIVDDGGVQKIRYTPPASVNGNGDAPVDETFSYAIKDNDNDMVTATITVAVADGAAPALTDGTGEVDEEGLTGGIAGVPAYNDGSDLAGESKTTGGTLAVTLGTDPLAADNPFNLTGSNSVAGLMTADGVEVKLFGPLSAEVLGETVVTYIGFRDGGSPYDSAAQVYLLTLNRDTGQWTFELKQPIQHQTDDTEDNTNIEFGVSVTDVDGSTGTGRIRILIDDDSPVAMLSTFEAPSQVLLDETPGQQVGDSDLTDGVSQATGGFQVSALFNSQYGADGAGTTSYALTKGNGDSFGTAIGTGTASGLYATSAPGTEIYLFQNGDVVEGRIGDDPEGTLAFTISLVGGEVQVEQWLALKHLSPAHQESVSVSLVHVTQTITDADGDSDSIGRALIVGFYDDGPSVTVLAGDDSEVILQTRDAFTDGDPTDEDVASSQADFSGVFSLSKNAGADGEKSSSITYELVFMPGFLEGGQSGLSIGGNPIYLHDIGGVMVGSTSAVEPASVADSSVVFTVAVESLTGIVTLTQLRQVDHLVPEGAPDYDDDVRSLANGLIGIKATGTITDGDDDTATDSETVDLGGNIRFADDGPLAGDKDFGAVVENSAQTTLSTVAAFVAANVQGGADEYQSGSFTLMDGANPVASLVGSLGGTLAIVAGELRYTPPASVDNDGSNTETFAYRIADKDGDTETGQITISITDGAAPALVLAEGSVDEEGLANGVAGTVYVDGSDIAGESKTTGGTLNVILGTDPLAADNAFNLTGVNNLGGLMTLDGTLVVLDGPTASGDAANTILTYVGYKTGGVATDPADQVFVLTLNRDTGQWSFELKQPVKHPGADTEDNLSVEFGVSVTDVDGSTGSNKIVVLIDDDSPDAKADFDSVENFLTTDGNVITGAGTSDPASGKDLVGADDAAVSAIASGNVPGNTPTPTTHATHGDGFVIQGEFGTLTIYADGYYSYTRSNGNPLVDSDVFTYTLKDGDADTDTATLTINIYDTGTELTVTDKEVDEQGLPIRTINAVIEPAGTGEAADGDGTDNDDKSEATTGSITFATPDGFSALTIQGKDGQVTIANGSIVEGLYGTLVVTAFDGPGGTLSYTYTLKDNVDHSGGPVSDDFVVVVTDIDGDQSTDTLNINII
ncbi:DUF5801 repeats-in-toxin domain-containing protein, partial [Dongia mobilis]|uniref:DUF5801 repeats-in-toxin domain-containing protein n=1 Tax=Dongia mobilis TaxID=578943 RepID=UPI001414FB13